MACALSVALFVNYRDRHATERQHSAAYQDQPRDEQHATVCVHSPIRGNLLCSSNRTPADESEYYAAYDLRAQQEMAEWAFLMALVSILGVAVTTTGVVYVARTLRETRNATRAAELAAQAAQAANAAFSDNAARELRAYVGVPVIVVHPMGIGAKPRFTYKIRNFGSTPARDLEAMHFLIGCQNPETYKARLPPQATPPKWSSRVDLAPGQDPVEVIAEFDLPLTSAMLSELSAGKGTIMLCGFVRYRDVFGKRHWTMFKGYVRKEVIAAGGSLTATRRHNRAN